MYLKMVMEHVRSSFKVVSEVFFVPASVSSASGNSFRPPRMFKSYQKNCPIKGSKCFLKALSDFFLNILNIYAAEYNNNRF